MREVSIVINNANIGVTPIESIKLIKESGFKNVFIQWYDKKWEPSQEEQLELIRKENLNVTFAHLGYKNINEIWKDSLIGEDLVVRYKQDLLTCKNNDIDLVVMHLIGTVEKSSYGELGLNRLK